SMSGVNGVIPSQEPAPSRRPFPGEGKPQSGFLGVEGMPSVTATGGESIVVGAELLDTRRPWSQTGGLSVPFALPTGGRQLTFSSVNEDPQLTLAVRPL